MSDFRHEWLADLGPWHAVGDTPFLARCLPSNPDGAVLILRPWGPWEEQRWRAVFSPPDRDDDGRDWRHGEIKAPDGGYWPDRESAEEALDAAWSAWRARYRASRGVAPDDGRRHNLLVTLTPLLLARIEALGFGGAPSDALAWLVGDAEKLRRSRDFHVVQLNVIRAVLSDPSHIVDGGFDSAGKVAAMARELQAVKAARDEARATAEELRLVLAAEQGRQKECLTMLDHLIAHVEDHGEDAASDSVYEDLLRLRTAMLAADKATETP